LPIAVRVEGSVAKRKECITPRYKEDSYISGFHSTVDFSFSTKGMLEMKGAASTIASSDRVLALLDSVTVLPRREGRSRASSKQFVELARRAGRTEAGGKEREALEQPSGGPGTQKDDGGSGLCWQIPVPNDRKMRRQTRSSLHVTGRRVGGRTG